MYIHILVHNKVNQVISIKHACLDISLIEYNGLKYFIHFMIVWVFSLWAYRIVFVQILNGK